jgi:hypothetical protein
MTTKEKRLMIKSTTKRWSDVDLVEVFNNGVKEGKQLVREECQKEIKLLENKYFAEQKVFSEHNDRVKKEFQEKIAMVIDFMYSEIQIKDYIGTKYSPSFCSEYHCKGKKNDLINLFIYKIKEIFGEQQ